MTDTMTNAISNDRKAVEEVEKHDNKTSIPRDHGRAASTINKKHTSK